MATVYNGESQGKRSSGASATEWQVEREQLQHNGSGFSHHEDLVAVAQQAYITTLNARSW